MASASVQFGIKTGTSFFQHLEATNWQTDLLFLLMPESFLDNLQQCGKGKGYHKEHALHAKILERTEDYPGQILLRFFLCIQRELLTL